MKTIRWWLLGCIVATAATAVWMGPAVFGQAQLPAMKPAAPIPPPVPTPPPLVPAPLTPPVAPVPPSKTPLVETIGVTRTEVQSPTPSAVDSLPPPALPRPEPMVAPFAKDTRGTTEVRLGRQEPAVALEWVGPPMARLNQPMACQILVRNTSASAVHQVVVRHRPGAGVSCRASEPVPAIDQGELVWSLGTLPAGQVRRIDLQLVATAKGPLTCQATVTFSGAAAHQVQINEPKLAVKMKAPERVLPGEPVTLLFAVSNPGDGPADAVKLKTVLSEGLEHPHGRAIEVDLGTLPPKEIRTLQLVCTARGNGPQKCLVTATGEGGLSAADESQLEIALPKLDLAMAGPKLRYIDRKAVYALRVTNPGTAPATNVVLHGAVPAGFKYHAASGGGLYDEGARAVAWVLGDLAPGQTRDVALELVPTAPGDHRVVAQVTSARGLKTEAQVHTVVEGLPALLIEVNDTDDPVEVGAETTYEVRVANVGTKTETNVEVVCTLPEQVEFRAAKAGSGLRFCVEGRELIFEPIAKLAPRADVIYRIQVRGRSPGDVRFRVRVRADGLTEPVLREECTRFYNDEGPTK